MPVALQKKRSKPEVTMAADPLAFPSEGSPVIRRSLRRSSYLSDVTTDNESSSGPHGRLLSMSTKQTGSSKVKAASSGNTTSRLAGSLLAAQIVEGSRRRNTFAMPPSKMYIVVYLIIISGPALKQSAPKEPKEKKVVEAETKPAVKKEPENKPLAVNIIQSPLKKELIVAAATTTSTPKGNLKPSVESLVAKPSKRVTLPALEPKDQSVTIKKLEDRLAELQAQFEQLSILRHTSAEQLLEDYKKTSATRDEAAQKLITSLRSENALLKERLAASSRGSRESNVSTLSAISSATTTVPSDLLFLYRSLSGLEIEALAEPSAWECAISGRLGAFQFELRYDPDEADYTYQPRLAADEAIWERLPVYLREEICFGEAHLQAFFWRVLNFLMEQQQQ